MLWCMDRTDDAVQALRAAWAAFEAYHPTVTAPGKLPRLPAGWVWTRRDGRNHAVKEG